MTEKKIVKICLLGATFETDNMGVGALAAAFITTAVYMFPDAEIYFLDYGKEGILYDFQVNNRKIKVKLLNMRFSKRVYLKNHILVLLFLTLVSRLLPFKSLRHKIYAQNPLLEEIDQFDLVGSIAGGDSFSDIYGLRRFLYVSLPQLIIILMGKELILLPQTLGPFNKRLPSAIARYIMNKAKTVYSRDKTGLEEMKGFMGNKYSSDKFIFSYDLGFVLDPIKPEKMELEGFLEKQREGALKIGLNISGLLAIGGYTRNNMFGLKVDYTELVHELIDILINKNGANVILIPHVFGENDESDSTICEKIYNELKEKYRDNLFLVQRRYNQNEIKYIIGLCDFFIGSRMHACIAGLSQHVPAVGIAYSKKFLGVFQSIGAESLVVDPCKIGKEEIITRIIGALEKREKIKEELERKMPEVKATILNLFKELK